MKLRNLLRDIPFLTIKGSKEISLTGLAEDSRKVATGNLFFARKGEHISQAVTNGAVAIATDLYDPFLPVTQIIYKDIPYLEALLAKRYYKHPSKELFLIGITGTNGKTTTSFLCREILEKSSCGLIGTVGYFVGKHQLGAELTTPPLLTNQKLLREMIKENCHSCAMEVSSHALMQERVRFLKFSAAIFTQITPEHLDYHHDMQSYAEAKKRLFFSLDKEAYAIINQDSPYAEFMREGIVAKVLTCGIDKECEVRANIHSLTLEESRFSLLYKGREYPFSSPLIGRFNIYNMLAAISVGLIREIPIPLLQHRVSTFRGAPGRMEKIKTSLPIHVFVDYAHTEDALHNVLSTLRSIARGKIITLFGCGGNRDPFKRPKMAQVSEQFSDHTIVTMDNPRSEDPQKILADILSGFSQKNYSVELDRQKAISHAISLANFGDIVLLAGKGHEKGQIFSHTTLPFDDVEVAKQELWSRER